MIKNERNICYSNRFDEKLVIFGSHNKTNISRMTDITLFYQLSQNETFRLKLLKEMADTVVGVSYGTVFYAL